MVASASGWRSPRHLVLLTRHTSRRDLLKRVAVLTAVPVAALGGVPVFDVVEELADGSLLADELPDWMREVGRPAARWMLSGDPVGYTQEATRADRKVWLEEQEFLRAAT